MPKPEPPQAGRRHDVSYSRNTKKYSSTNRREYKYERSTSKFQKDSSYYHEKRRGYSRPEYERSRDQNRNDRYYSRDARGGSPSFRRHGSSNRSRRRRTRSRSYNEEEDSYKSETEVEKKARWNEQWQRTKQFQPPRPVFPTNYPKKRGFLKVEYWERTDYNADRKQAHMDQLDRISRMSREQWILNTTLLGVHVAMEPNLFPYETPAGVTHYTLWSRTYMEEDEIESYVESWLDTHRSSVEAWAWDPSNLSEGMSIDLFHVHVYFWEPPKQLATLEPSLTRSHKANLEPPRVG